MGNAQKPFTRYAGTALVVGLLVVVYALADLSLASNVPVAMKHHGSLTSGGAAATGVSTVPQSPGNVSSATVQAIAQSLQGVNGVNELVVLPNTSGSGVTVSATVDIADHTVPESTWSPIVQNDVRAFFTGLYKSGENVQNAEVYFTVNQKVIAGADVGVKAYQDLTTQTATGGSGFVQALASAPMVTNEGAKDIWFQTQTTPNAP